MDGYIKKSEAVDVIVKYPYDIAGKTATAIKMIEDLPSADVVPKSECDKWYNEYHAIKYELKQEKMYHKETEKLVDRYCVELQTAKSEVEKLEKEVERLKHILDCYALQYGTVKEQQAVIDKANQELASEIFAEIYERLLLSFPAQSFIDAPCTTHDRLFNMVAELKKKYTEGYDGRV